MDTLQWTPKSEWQQGVYGTGSIKLDHLESMRPIFRRKISTLLTSICSNSLFLHAEKETLYTGPQEWITARVVWPWGNQVGSFGVHETYFWEVNLHFINKLYAALPFPAYRESDILQCSDPKGQEWMIPTQGPNGAKSCAIWQRSWLHLIFFIRYIVILRLVLVPKFFANLTQFFSVCRRRKMLHVAC